LLNSRSEVQALSRRFGINTEDIELIALNACGVRSRLPHPRMRFRLRLLDRPDEQLFFILPLGREASPFELRPDRILLFGEPWADVEMLDNDDAVLSYFRNGHKVLTLNSNARSQCTGCAFCPNTLEAASDPRLGLMDDLDTYLTVVEQEMGWQSLAPLETVTVCTGCFRFESRAIAHLAHVRRLLAGHECEARIQFLSSVLRSPEGFAQIEREVGLFHLTLTVECFTGRDLVLKESKASLTYPKMLEVLKLARAHGCKVDMTYIVGIDPLAALEKHLPALTREVNTFPRFQVYQAHNRFMELCADPLARTNLEYYLTARQLIEGWFRDRDIRPRSWENYRPLWYFTFANEELSSVRI
jgi:hypothetical protein